MNINSLFYFRLHKYETQQRILLPLLAIKTSNTLQNNITGNKPFRLQKKKLVMHCFRATINLGGRIRNNKFSWSNPLGQKFVSLTYRVSPAMLS